MERACASLLVWPPLPMPPLVSSSANSLLFCFLFSSLNFAPLLPLHLPCSHVEGLLFLPLIDSLSLLLYLLRHKRKLKTRDKI